VRVQSNNIFSWYNGARFTPAKDWRKRGQWAKSVLIIEGDTTLKRQFYFRTDAAGRRRRLILFVSHEEFACYQKYLRESFYI
jgi:hypothetical protein